MIMEQSDTQGQNPKRQPLSHTAHLSQNLNPQSIPSVPAQSKLSHKPTYWNSSSKPVWQNLGKKVTMTLNSSEIS